MPTDDTRTPDPYLWRTKTSIRDGSPTGRFVVDWEEAEAALAARPAPDSDLDVERLAEAIFRVGTGYRQRETATIAARIANSQDGARASGEFAEAIAAEYARLRSQHRPPGAVDVERLARALCAANIGHYRNWDATESHYTVTPEHEADAAAIVAGLADQEDVK